MTSSDAVVLMVGGVGQLYVCTATNVWTGVNTTWTTPGTIGSSSPNTGAFTTLSATGKISLTTGNSLCWNNDTGISRDSADIVDFGNCTPGDVSATVKAASAIFGGAPLAGCTAGLEVGSPICGVFAMATGVSTNTDGAGNITASGSSALYNFVGTYTVRPICWARDVTTNVMVATLIVTTTTLTATTTGATDSVDYGCTPRD